MPVTLKNKNSTLYAFLKGEIDHHTAPELRECIDDAIILNDAPNLIVLDFGGVTFMDSSGIGLVMGRYKLLSQNGAELAVTNPSPQIYKVMHLAGLERLAKIEKGGMKNETVK